MTVRLESLTFTSGDGETSVPSYLATPGTRRWPADSPSGATWPWYTAGRFAGRPDGRTVYADLQGAMTFLGSVGEGDLIARELRATERGLP